MLMYEKQKNSHHFFPMKDNFCLLLFANIKHIVLQHKPRHRYTGIKLPYSNITLLFSYTCLYTAMLRSLSQGR